VPSLELQELSGNGIFFTKPGIPRKEACPMHIQQPSPEAAFDFSIEAHFGLFKLFWLKE